MLLLKCCDFYLKAIASIQFWHQRLAILCCKLPRQSYKFAAPSMTSQTKRRHHDVIPHAVVDNFTKILKSHDKSHQITTYSRWHANFLRLFDNIRCKQCWHKIFNPLETFCTINFWSWKTSSFPLTAVLILAKKGLQL